MSRSLSGPDKVAYLANVMSLAGADRKAEPEKRLFLRDVADRIGANETHMQEAGKLASSGRYSLQPGPDPATRMANIEDMVSMSLVDGEMSDNESRPIERLAGIMKLCDADLDQIVKRSRNRLRRFRSDNPRINSEIRQKEDPKPPRKPSELSKTADAPGLQSFKEQYRESPELMATPGQMETPDGAGVAPGMEPVTTDYQPPSERQKQTSQIEWSDQDHRPTAKIVSEAPRQTRPVNENKSDFKSDEYESAEDAVSGCMRKRENSECPAEYCFGAGSGTVNPWGCRLLNMDWRPEADWLTYGQFRDDRAFLVNKEGIGRMLAARMKHVSSCPYFSESFARTFLDEMPARILKTRRWRYRRAAPGEQVKRTIYSKQYIQGLGTSVRIDADGMSPESNREAIILIENACRKAGRRINTAVLEKVDIFGSNCGGHTKGKCHA